MLAADIYNNQTHQCVPSQPYNAEKYWRKVALDFTGLGFVYIAPNGQVFESLDEIKQFFLVMNGIENGLKKFLLDLSLMNVYYADYNYDENVESTEPVINKDDGGQYEPARGKGSKSCLKDVIYELAADIKRANAGYFKITRRKISGPRNPGNSTKQRLEERKSRHSCNSRSEIGVGNRMSPYFKKESSDNHEKVGIKTQRTESRMSSLKDMSDKSCPSSSDALTNSPQKLIPLVKEIHKPSSCDAVTNSPQKLIPKLSTFKTMKTSAVHSSFPLPVKTFNTHGAPLSSSSGSNNVTTFLYNDKIPTYINHQRIHFKYIKTPRTKSFGVLLKRLNTDNFKTPPVKKTFSGPDSHHTIKQENRKSSANRNTTARCKVFTRRKEDRDHVTMDWIPDGLMAAKLK